MQSRMNLKSLIEKCREFHDAALQDGLKEEAGGISIGHERNVKIEGIGAD